MPLDDTSRTTAFSAGEGGRPGGCARLLSGVVTAVSSLSPPRSCEADERDWVALPRHSLARSGTSSIGGFSSQTLLRAGKCQIVAVIVSTLGGLGLRVSSWRTHCGRNGAVGGRRHPSDLSRYDR